MLQNYIENFANSLGVKPEDQAKIEAEALTGDYTITLNDKLVCSIGEIPAPEDGGAPLLRFSVAFCGSDEDDLPREDDARTLLDKYARMDAELLESPPAGTGLPGVPAGSEYYRIQNGVQSGGTDPGNV